MTGAQNRRDVINWNWKAIYSCLCVYVMCSFYVAFIFLGIARHILYNLYMEFELRVSYRISFIRLVHELYDWPSYMAWSVYTKQTVTQTQPPLSNPFTFSFSLSHSHARSHTLALSLSISVSHTVILSLTLLSHSHNIILSHTLSFSHTFILSHTLTMCDGFEPAISSTTPLLSLALPIELSRDLISTYIITHDERN